MCSNGDIEVLDRKTSPFQVGLVVTKGSAHFVGPSDSLDFSQDELKASSESFPPFRGREAGELVLDFSNYRLRQQYVRTRYRYHSLKDRGISLQGEGEGVGVEDVLHPGSSEGRWSFASPFPCDGLPHFV